MKGALSFLIAAVSAVLLLAAPATAAVLSTPFPFAGAFTNPCTGELITFAGSLNLLVGTFVDGGGEVSANIHSNFEGIVGAALSGQYQIPVDLSQSTGLGTAPVTLSLTNNFRAVGATSEFSGSFPISITIGGTGGISASAGTIQVVCQ